MSVVQELSQRLRTAIAGDPLGAISPFGSPIGHAKVIAIAAQKGGVGKTTTAVQLAVALAEKHHLRTLLLDLDNQGHVASSLRAHVRTSAQSSLSQVLLGQQAELLQAVLPTGIEGLWISAADRNLGAAEATLASRIGREMLLTRALKAARQQFDAIVLDCPPNLGLLTLNALSAADEVLIPCDLSVLSLEGVDDLLRTLDQLQQTFGRAPHILGLLHTRVDRRNQKQNAAIRRAVADRYQGLALPVEIAVNTALPGAQLVGKSIFASDPDSAGARDYAALADEVKKRLFSRSY